MSSVLQNKHFLDWIGVDKVSLSWEEKYLEEFNSFWGYILDESIEVQGQFTRIGLLVSRLPNGPLKSWCIWLEESYIQYLFAMKDLTLIELSNSSLKNISEVSFIVRKLLISNYPNLQEEINLKFSIFSQQDDNSRICFKEFISDKHIILVPQIIGRNSLKDLEITLLGTWEIVREILPRTSKEKNKNNSKPLAKKQMSFFQELILLFVISGVLILSVQIANKWYEGYLSKQVTLLESDFFWLDKSLVFETKKTDVSDIELEYAEIENIEKAENNLIVTNEVKLSRYEDESDVIVTSMDTIPQNFEVAKSELSSYEEKRKGGYRDFRYGRRKAYRVMLTSVNPDDLKRKLHKILNKYQVEKVDNVDPGKKIPGGIYFNLYVPKRDVKSMLSKMNELQGATVLESKTIFGGPKNMDKVFIWIKKV